MVLVLEEVRRAAAGSGADFDALVRRHRGRVKAIALRILRDPDEAEDVAQEVFAAVHQKLGDLRGPAFTAWLSRVAVNESLNHLRARKRRRRHEAGAAEAARLFVLAPPPPPEQLEADERKDRVRADIARVPEPFREALRLRDVAGLDYGEIAARLSVRPGTVKSRIARGRAFLRGR